MSYGKFRMRMHELAQKVGSHVSITCNTDKGRYEARFSNGLFITGNSISTKLTAKGYNGFTAMFE